MHSDEADPPPESDRPPGRSDPADVDVTDNQPADDPLTEWLRQMVLAHNGEELADVVSRVPPHLLHGGRLQYVATGAAGPADATSTTAGAASPSVRVMQGGRAVGRLWLHGVSDPSMAPAVLGRVGGLLEGVLETLSRLDRRERSATPAAAPEAYFERLFAVAPEGIVVLDHEDRVVRANRKFEEMFGYTIEEIVGRTINELIVPPELQDQAIGLTNQVAQGTDIEEETIRCRSDGTRLHVSILGTPVIVHGDQVAVYGIYRDITAQKATEEALRRLSTTDELTGLFNRRGFFMLAEQQRHLAVRKKSELLLLYIDIDDFKRINDEFGHLEGDRVLADLGEILRSCYRESDVLARVGDGGGIMARMGGDEFVVLAFEPGPDGERILTTRLKERLAQYNRRRHAQYQVAVSIGAARLVAEADVTIDSLLAAADTLMYDAKRGRSQS
jgi:diguanylate cyclase (GGDEF)-like protein/PAS domain S-box-containing protein